jgi:homocysteine S-methyltransferase
VLDLATGIRRMGIDTVFISPAQSTRAQLTAVDLAVHLQKRLDIEAVASVPTWGRTIMALQADLIGAHALGVQRIVCETGTPPLLADYPHIDGVWDVDSLGLIELLASLNAGVDYNGLRVATSTSFEIGARVNPGATDLQAEIHRARQKISAGASYLLSRPAYDTSSLLSLLDAIRDTSTPVLVSVRPLTSFVEAEYLSQEVPDVRIPATSLQRLEHAGTDAERAGIDLAAELVHEIRDHVSGVVIDVRDEHLSGVADLTTAALAQRG